MSRLLALSAVTACSGVTPGLPWLHGLQDAVSSTGIDEPRAPADEVRDGCGVGAGRPIELVADVAPAGGRERITASYSGGIAVFDREDHLVAELPGYACEGSADELDAVAFGHAYGDPLLALAATTGGRNEAATWVSLIRAGRTLEPVFTAVVEHRVDDKVERGAIYLLPGGLLYQRPGGQLAFWRLDPGARVYVPVESEQPHAEPLLSLR